MDPVWPPPKPSRPSPIDGLRRLLTRVLGTRSPTRSSQRGAIGARRWPRCNGGRPMVADRRQAALARQTGPQSSANQADPIPPPAPRRPPGGRIPRAAAPSRPLPPARPAVGAARRAAQSDPRQAFGPCEIPALQAPGRRAAILAGPHDHGRPRASRSNAPPWRQPPRRSRSADAGRPRAIVRTAGTPVKVRKAPRRAIRAGGAGGPTPDRGRQRPRGSERPSFGPGCVGVGHRDAAQGPASRGGRVLSYPERSGAGGLLRERGGAATEGGCVANSMTIPMVTGGTDRLKRPRTT